MLELETRPFEARFGDRCPFCNRTWNDRNPCGDSRADWTMRDGLRLLFADKVDNCVVCDRQVQHGRKYCFDCGLSVERERNKGNRHAWIAKTCAHCESPFETQDKTQRACSISCGNRLKPKKQFCVNGHDTFVVGRNKKSACKQCVRDIARAQRERMRAA